MSHLPYGAGYAPTPHSPQPASDPRQYSQYQQHQNYAQSSYAHPQNPLPHPQQYQQFSGHQYSPQTHPQQQPQYSPQQYSPQQQYPVYPQTAPQQQPYGQPQNVSYQGYSGQVPGRPRSALGHTHSYSVPAAPGYVNPPPLSPSAHQAALARGQPLPIQSQTHTRGRPLPQRSETLPPPNGLPPQQQRAPSRSPSRSRPLPTPTPSTIPRSPAKHHSLDLGRPLPSTQQNKRVCDDPKPVSPVAVAAPETASQIRRRASPPRFTGGSGSWTETSPQPPPPEPSYQVSTANSQYKDYLSGGSSTESGKFVPVWKRSIVTNTESPSHVSSRPLPSAPERTAPSSGLKRGGSLHVQSPAATKATVSPEHSEEEPEPPTSESESDDEPVTSPVSSAAGIRDLPRPPSMDARASTSALPQPPEIRNSAFNARSAPGNMEAGAGSRTMMFAAASLKKASPSTWPTGLPPLPRTPGPRREIGDLEDSPPISTMRKSPAPKASPLASATPTPEPPTVPSISIASSPNVPTINLPEDEDQGPTITIDGPDITVRGPDAPQVPPLAIVLDPAESGPDRPSHRALPAKPMTERQKRGLACGLCERPVLGRVVRAMGLGWHPECFRCTVCNELLEHASLYEKDGRLYCHLDYHEQFAPRCYSCKTAIVAERFISLDDPELGKRTYHEQHFFCSECGDPFLPPSLPATQGEIAFSGDGSFVSDDVGFTVYRGYPYCEACHVRLRLPKCKKCKKSIRDHEDALEALGGKWCYNCFCCTGCEKPFEDPSFFERDGKPWCESCFTLMLRNDV